MKWDEFFKIVKVYADDGKLVPDDEWVWGEDVKYQLRDPDNKIIATYKDLKYARKQAKYKFRRLQTRLETILLRK